MFLLFITYLAFADETKYIKYQAKTEIDFEAIDIEGQLVKPQGSLIMERTHATFNPLIELRTDWNPEMRKSVELIK